MQKNQKKYFPVCSQEQLSLLNSKEFILYKNKRPYFGFVVQKDNDIYAYANNCPHQGRMLQWKPDRYPNGIRLLVIQSDLTGCHDKFARVSLDLPHNLQAAYRKHLTSLLEVNFH